MTRRPKLLDLFSGAGGCSVGYARAGFEVTGVDIVRQPRYPFRFIQADALEYAAEHGLEYDAISASPPCQAYSVCGVLPKCQREYADLLPQTRDLLMALGQVWVLENVPGAPMPDAVMLCGTMFGLRVFRHRLFESSILLLQPPHVPHGGRRIGFDGYVCVAGHGDGGRRTRVAKDHRTKASWARAMGIDWMTKRELTQAIPPAYTQFLGQQLRNWV